MEPDLTLPSPELSRLRIRGDARPQRRRKKGLLLLVPLFLAAAAVTAYTLRDRILGLGLGPIVETAVVLRTGGVSERAVLTANGYVTARRQAGVTAKVSGRIRRLLKDLGDHVVKGEILAELEDQDVQAALDEVKATLWVDELNAERAGRLAEKSVGTQAEYDLAVAKLKETTARKKNLEEQVENTKVRAPFDGVIIVKNGEVGETVSLFGAQTSRKSGPIFVVADFREFEIEADINEANIAKVTPGQEAEIGLDAVPERRYRGRLRQIVPTADRQKATIQVKVSLLDPDAKVYPEMSAKVTFLREGGEPEPVRIAAPAEGIVDRRGRRVVLVVDEGRVQEVPVETGPSEGGRTIITGGLSGGESIVLRPPEGLASGTRIRLKKAQ